jgi:hypothetical protein
MPSASSCFNFPISFLISVAHNRGFNNESKRAGEILENLKLGCVSSKDSSDTDIETNIIDIGSIPDTFYNA